MRRTKKMVSALCAGTMLATTLAGGSFGTFGGDLSAGVKAAGEDETVNLVWYIAGTAPNKPADVVKALNETL